MATGTCKIDKVETADVVVTLPKDIGSDAKKTAKDKAQLKDMVTFNVIRFKPAAVSAECIRKLVLFINGSPVADAHPVREKPMTFILERAEKSRELWRLLLGRPSIGETRDITVGFGLPDGPALYSAGIKIEALPTCRFYHWCGILLVLVIVFGLCAIKTSILRDGSPDAGATPGSKAIYSLGRMQAAWWLFVILACYMLIGVATGDFLSSINGTAVILLGIGAGAALGGAAVDASKDTPANRHEQQVATMDVKKPDGSSGERYPVQSTETRCFGGGSDARCREIERNAGNGAAEEGACGYASPIQQAHGKSRRTSFSTS